MSTLIERMLRAARLEAELYEEVEADKQTLGQAMAVIVLSSVAAGIGGATGVGGIIVGTLGAFLGWYVWAYLAYLIGTQLLPEPQTRSDLGELLRTTGFASAPGLFRLLGIIPPLRQIVFVIASLWMLAAMVVAVRQALDYKGTGRAIAVCAIGWAVQVFILALLLWALAEPVGPT